MAFPGLYNKVTHISTELTTVYLLLLYLHTYYTY